MDPADQALTLLEAQGLTRLQCPSGEGALNSTSEGINMNVHVQYSASSLANASRGMNAFM